MPEFELSFRLANLFVYRKAVMHCQLINLKIATLGRRLYGKISLYIAHGFGLGGRQ